MSWFPSVVPAFISFLFKNGLAVEPYNRVDISHRILNIPNYFPHHHETEVVVGVAQCADAIKLLKKFVVEHDIPLNYITEVK